MHLGYGVHHCRLSINSWNLFINHGHLYWQPFGLDFTRLVGAWGRSMRFFMVQEVIFGVEKPWVQ